jgi:hypothetical protein
MREIRTSGSMRGRRNRTSAQRACALLYRSPWLVSFSLPSRASVFRGIAEYEGPFTWKSGKWRAGLMTEA